jgi:AcrR family transcriptional regulator
MKERRRGAALEQALLDAASAELSEKGYAKFTMDAVATRAGTSTPVLYRRWSNKRDLVQAAIGHVARNMKIKVSHTGSLRGDVLALMRQCNHPDAGLLTMVSVHLAGYFRETGTGPAELIDVLTADLPLVGALDAIYNRASDRGEVDLARLTARMRTLPFDLLRTELMMTLQPVPGAVMEEMVDTIFLPVVQTR